MLLAIVILFHWKLTLTHQYTWLESPDMANLVLPWFQFQAGEWHHHRFPLWDPNSWFGQPLFGQAQPGSAYPLNWLLFLAPLKNGWMRESTLNWYYVLMRALAALTAYAFARDLGRSRAASILAGCVYALGGYVAFTRAPQMVNGAVWTPLVFLYLLRAERGQRPWASALLSGFFLGFGWLAGHHQMNLFVSIAAASLWIWLSLRDGQPNWKMARLAAGSLAIAVLASGFQTLPTAEYGPLAVRWSGAPDDPLRFDRTVPYTVHEDYALKPLGLLSVVLPGIAPSSDPYVGIVAFTLALLGTILAWRTRQVRWLAALSLGGILFSLGPNSLLHGVLYALVPLVEKARVPGAGTVVFAVGLAPLVAFGVDSLAAPASWVWSRRAGWALGVLAGVLALLSLVLYAIKINELGDDRIMITALAAALAAALLAAWRAGEISARAGAVGATCLVLFELANVNGYAFPNRNNPAANPFLPPLSQHSDLADYVRGHDGLKGVGARVAYDDTLIPYNIGDWYGIEAVNAYTASVLANVWNMNLFSPRGRNFFGVRYYFGKTPLNADYKWVMSVASGLKVFENSDAYPRVWSVHRGISLPGLAELRRKMDDPAFDPRHTALLTSTAPNLGACGSSDDDVQMPMHMPNYVQIQAHLRCRGMVILTDPYFPGWRAYVDGKRAPIVEAYGGVRGVVVEAGDHLVEMRYRPWSVLLGALMTLAAALITIIVNRRSSSIHCDRIDLRTLR